MQLDSEAGQDYHTQINKELLYTVKRLSRDSQRQAEKAMVDIFLHTVSIPTQRPLGQGFAIPLSLAQKGLAFYCGSKALGSLIWVGIIKQYIFSQDFTYS